MICFSIFELRSMTSKVNTLKCFEKMKEAFAGAVSTERKGSFSKVADSDLVVADDCLLEE